MSTPIETPDEVHLLHHDVLLIHEAWQQLGREQTIDAKPGECRFYRIAGDLWRQHIDHCQAVAVLLNEQLLDSAVVVNRAAYEVAITLTYLRTIGDRHRNAALFEAHMVADTAAVLGDGEGKIDPKAQRAIDAIPKDVMAAVNKNRKARRPWSGKTIVEMAEAIQVSGHRGRTGNGEDPASKR
jgi:hypothetical protein